MESKMMRGLRIPVAVLMALALVMGVAAAPSFAAAPDKEKVKYLGKGKVEVEFWQDVDYKNTKVQVEDTSGKAYKAKIYDKDDDELKFRIQDYKKGETYKFTIQGIRAEYTSKFGSVSGKVTIKKADKSANITAQRAKEIALEDAGLTKSQVYRLKAHKDYDDGKAYYEVSFKTKKKEYDYEISMKGRILDKDIDRNDDWDD